MKRVFLLVILVVACGCKRSDYAGSEGEATLSFSPSFSADKAADKADSRATATSFEDGDRVGVYVVKEGQALRDEFNAIDNHLFEYFAVGDSLGSVPMAMYYPDKSTPVAIYAYYPYKYGGERFSALAMPFNVAKNQRAGDALTTSDLCLSRSGFAAPSASPRSLAFYHALSQVVVNVDHSAVADVDSLYSVKFIDVKSGVSVNLGDGALTLQETHSFVITNSVAILPPQTFEAGKLIELQVRMNSGELATYYFNPLTEITIEAKKRNTLSLKLRNDYTAELSSDLAISPWIGGAGNGQLTDKVSNDFTLTYLNPKQGFTNIDRVVLTISGKEYEATNVEAQGNADGSAKITFEIKDNAPIEYPYTITALKMFEGEKKHTTIGKQLTAPEIYKTGNSTISIDDPFAMPIEASNCYMVSPNGSVTFGLFRQAPYFSTPYATVASMKVLWQTGINHGSTAGGANMIIRSVNYAANGVCTVSANNGSGNAVVAAYSGANGTGDILWSWHIWVTQPVGHSQALPAANQAAAGGPGKLFMDRNLGAITKTQGNVGAYGMFYQWGRKDPFTPSVTGQTTNPGGTAVAIFDAVGMALNNPVNGISTTNGFKYLASNADNLTNAIKNPMTYYYNGDGSWTSNSTDCNNYWRAPSTTPANAGYVDNRGDAKGIYDPCPTGYRIAANGAYAGFPANSWTIWDKSGGTSWLGIWWPAAGYRNIGTGQLHYTGNVGYAWSSSPQSVIGSHRLYFDNISGSNPNNNHHRAHGFSVRCVQE